MYEPPVKLFEQPMQAIMEARENAIFAQIQANFHVEVDKDELVRALQYDRDQYDKGYKDGKADAAFGECGGWVSSYERLPEKSGIYLVINEGGHYAAYNYSAKNKAFNSFDSHSDHDHDIRCPYWMPMPTPPEGVTVHEW